MQTGGRNIKISCLKGNFVKRKLVKTFKQKYKEQNTIHCYEGNGTNLFQYVLENQLRQEWAVVNLVKYVQVLKLIYFS